MPEFPGGEKMYIGSTDVPLSPLGRIQGLMAGIWLKGPGFDAVYSSPLSRAYDTAKMICPSPVIRDGLREMYAGDWEGLTFSEVRARWPELYARRGSDQNIPIPNAESVEDGRARFSKTVDGILGETRGDVVIVAHLSVIRAYICEYLGVPLSRSRSIQIPCGSVTVMEADGETRIGRVGAVPSVPLSDEVCASVMEASGAGERTRAHCVKVAEKAGEIADALISAGCGLDRALITRSALLHDIARPERCHAEAGGRWIEELGYPEEGRIVSLHHSVLPVEVSEAAVVGMADRVVSGTETVGFEKRFAASAAKCAGAEAAAAHRARYENALALKNLFNSVCGSDIIG